MSRARIGALFAGYGGLDLGVQAVIDSHVAWTSEFDTNPSRILAHHHPDVPNHGDITRINWANTEPVDIITGGFPCQDVSHAGARRGLRGTTRTGLWSYMRDAINHHRPRLVVAENVRGLLSADADSAVEPCPWCLGDADSARPLRALGAVLADLADIGYDAFWCGLRAADIGAPHGRFRVFIFAWPQAADAPSLGRGEGWAEPARIVGRPHAPGGGHGLLPTPTVSDTNGAGQHGAGGLDLRAAVSLLPTPAVNDMGKAYTPDEWDQWTAKMRSTHGNGNGHGKSLEIEAARMLPTPTTAPTTGNGHARNVGGEVSLMPTPRASDGDKGGPNQRGSSGDPMLPSAVQSFGDYAHAIARWEHATRPAPAPTEPTGKAGAHRLSPAFVEWMMGLPSGHVTDPAIWHGMTASAARNAQLKALGNGVVPQQAAEATRRFLAWAHTEQAAA